MFPSLKDPEHANVRLKNVGRQVYLCVTQDGTGNPVLGTKTLNEAVDPDGEYFHSASYVLSVRQIKSNVQGVRFKSRPSSPPHVASPST
jgi:hypothetical protein